MNYKLSNYFEPSPKNIQRWILLIKGIIATVGGATYFTSHKDAAFFIMLAGGILDQLSNFIGSSDSSNENNSGKLSSWLFLLFASMLVLSGCATDLKIERKIERMNIKHPVAVATEAEKLYPCDKITQTILKVDSTDFKQWKNNADSLNTLYNSLLRNLPAPILIHDTTKACDEYRANELKYKNIISVQNNDINQLQYLIAHPKPIVDSVKSTTENKRGIFLAQDSTAKMKTKYDIAQDSLDFYKPHFWWFVVEHGIVALLAIIYFIAKFYKSRIPKF